MESRLSVLKDSIVGKGINVFDCLEHYNLSDVWDGTRREQQIKCPGFHGVDRKKSARVYDTGTMFCWACDASYDVFAFEMKMTGKSFVEVIYDLAQRYGIEYELEEDRESSVSKGLSEIKELFSNIDKNRPKNKFKDYLNNFSKKITQYRDVCSLVEYNKYWDATDRIEWLVLTNALSVDEAIMHLESMYSSIKKHNV